MRGTYPWPAAVGTISYNNNVVLANGMVVITAGGERLALNFIELHVGQTGCGALPTVESSTAGDVYAVAWNAQTCDTATCSSTHSVYSGFGCMAVAMRGAVMTMTVETGACTPADFPAAATSGVASCPDYYVIDSRGSGETPGTISPPGAHFISVFKRLKAGKSVQYTHNPYPAPGWKSFVGAALHQSGAAYWNSVNTGESWLIAKLKGLSSSCPQTKVILTGYSQGAQVAGDVGAARWPNVLAVVLFGDPLFNSADARVDRGGYHRGVNGALGTRARFAPRSNQVFVSYCHANDPVCQKGNGLVYEPNHTTYDKLNEPAEAANLAAAKG